VGTDGDGVAYDEMRGQQRESLTRTAELVGITLGELWERHERLWHRELEQAWGAIQQVADMLLAGATVTDAVVRDLVDELWARYEDDEHDQR
jgi:hypothetical protein